MHIQTEDSERPNVPKGAEHFTRHVLHLSNDTHLTYLYIHAWHVQPNPDSASRSLILIIAKLGKWGYCTVWYCPIESLVFNNSYNRPTYINLLVFKEAWPRQPGTYCGID